ILISLRRSLRPSAGGNEPPSPSSPPSSPPAAHPVRAAAAVSPTVDLSLARETAPEAAPTTWTSDGAVPPPRLTQRSDRTHWWVGALAGVAAAGAAVTIASAADGSGARPASLGSFHVER